jgi:hypothetical protein
MPPPMLLGSGGKPDIQDLNGLEVNRSTSRRTVPSLRAENKWSPSCSASSTETFLWPRSPESSDWPLISTHE